jgi:hypothetical protein
MLWNVKCSGKSYGLKNVRLYCVVDVALISIHCVQASSEPKNDLKCRLIFQIADAGLLREREGGKEGGVTT